MTADERQYYLRRAGQEDAAARSATCAAAAERHAELARLYRMRCVELPEAGTFGVDQKEPLEAVPEDVPSRLPRSLQVA